MKELIKEAKNDDVKDINREIIVEINRHITHLEWVLS